MTTLTLSEALDVAIKATVEKQERFVFAAKTAEAEDGGNGRLTPEIKKDYARYKILTAAVDELKKHKRQVADY